MNARFHGKFISNVGVNYFVGIQLRKKKNSTVIANGRRMLTFRIFISFIYFMMIEINHVWISQFLTILDYIWISERNSQLSSNFQIMMEITVDVCWCYFAGYIDRVKFSKIPSKRQCCIVLPKHFCFKFGQYFSAVS